MKPTDEGFELSTGKHFYANRNILGLSPTEKDLFNGYDGVVGMWSDNAPFTPRERQEIADYMISLWKDWATHA